MQQLLPFSLLQLSHSCIGRRRCLLWPRVARTHRRLVHLHAGEADAGCLLKVKGPHAIAADGRRTGRRAARGAGESRAPAELATSVADPDAPSLASSPTIQLRQAPPSTLASQLLLRHRAHCLMPQTIPDETAFNDEEIDVIVPPPAAL